MRTSLFSLFLLLTAFAFSQKPREVQVENGPVDWSNPINIFVLIVIPLIALIFFLMWRQKRKK